MGSRNTSVFQKADPVWGWLLVPFCLFYTATFFFWTDLPIEDDYSGLLGFALAWKAAKGWRQHLITLLSYQHNEYKLFLINAIVAFQVWSVHELRFGAWMFIGDLLPLVCLYVLWRAMPSDLKSAKKLTAFIPVVWLMLTLNYGEVMNWAMVETQMLTGVTLSLCCLYCLTRKEASPNAWAVVFAMGACLANANAFLLAPIGAVLLFTRRRHAVLAVWTLGFVTVFCAYLFRYQTPERLGVLSLVKVLGFFLAAIGDVVGFHDHYFPAAALGFLLILGFLYAVVHRFDRANAFALWTAVYLLLTFALMAFGRAGLGVAGALASRYKINSDLMVIVLYLLGVSNRAHWDGLQWSRRQLFVAAAVPCILIGLLGDAYGVRAMWIRRHSLVYGMAHYQLSNGQASPMVYSAHPPAGQARPGVEEEAREVLNEARSEGLYRIPSHY